MPDFPLITLCYPVQLVTELNLGQMTEIIPATQSAHVLLHAGQQLRIVNPSGHPVVDVWAFTTSGVPRWMSTAQTRSKLQRLIPIVGDSFVDTQRQPIFTLIEDTSSGIHDMIFPPCDDWRYAEAGAIGHESCAANLKKELTAVTSILRYEAEEEQPLIELESKMRAWGWTPEPLNLFMNVPVGSMDEGEKGLLQVKRPFCEPGASVTLRADANCLIVMSACPNDLLDTNSGKPSNAAYEVSF